MKFVVTGLGLLSSAGTNIAENWATISRGTSTIIHNTVVPTDGLRSSMGGQTQSVREEGPPRSSKGYLDRCHRLAEAAAQEALAHARAESFPDRSRIAISLGTSLGGARSGEEFHRQWITQGLRSANAGLLRQYPLHSVADYLAATFRLFGPRSVQSNACAAGAVAIAYGVELLRSCMADAVLAGGVDPLTLLSFGGFSSLKALDPHQCSPYVRSSGLNLGEGAGFLVLEREATARARGAAIHAELAGYGLSADAYHPTAPDPMGRGALRAMKAALAMADTGVEEVDYINGHGTGTSGNDTVEIRAISALRESASPPVSSTKSMIGHTLGAAGAVEAVVSVLALQHQQAPPTAVPSDARPPCGVDIVPQEGRHMRLRNVLSNSFAFGGNNAALVIRAYEESHAVPKTPHRQVVVTGIGALVGEAAQTAEVRAALFAGRRVYGHTVIEVEDFGAFPYGDIPEEHLKRGIDPKHSRHMDTLGKRSALAVAQLLRERGLTREEVTEAGLMFATDSGPTSTVEAFERGLILNGCGNPLMFPNTVMNAAPGHVALLHKIGGPTATICCGKTGAVTALHFAHSLIMQGKAERVIVLAADEAPEAALAAYARIPGYLSKTLAVPYGNSGSVIAGAAVAVLLEREDLVDAEHVLGRIDGFGMAGDASGPGRLDAATQAWSRSFQLALGGCSPQEVDVVVAAACGRSAVDRLEAAALARAGLDQQAISAPKAVWGDAGASSVLLGVAQALWMAQERRIPANACVASSGPSGLVGAQARPLRVRQTLVSSYEVGGNFQAVLIRS